MPRAVWSSAVPADGGSAGPGCQPCFLPAIPGLWLPQLQRGASKGRNMCYFLNTLGANRSGGGCVCVTVFTLHANLDVPIVAQTSWCCRRSSQKLFCSVVKFNFNVFLCHRMCSLPSCWGRPSRAALAGCGHPRGGRAADQPCIL